MTAQHWCPHRSGVLQFFQPQLHLAALNSWDNHKSKAH